MLKRFLLKLRIRSLERQGADAGLRLMELDSRIRQLHPESLERELLLREADILERVLLALDEKESRLRQELLKL